MTDERLGPEILSTRGVPAARRGYDKRVVDALLSEAAKHWETLAREHDELRAAVEDSGGLEFLGREMSEVARDVGSILEAAREAADGMRTRAREDADRLDRETDERIVALLAEAERQAFDLRQDAWEGGLDAIESAAQEAASTIERGGDDGLLIRAQAEKESHRLVAAARKEADDLVRTARYEADRQLNQAREVAQQIIDRAVDPGAPAGSQDLPPDPVTPERRRALLEEIEALRANRSIETIEVFSTSPASVSRSVAPADEVDPDGIDLSDELAAEVEQMRGSEPAPVVKIMTNESVQFGSDDDVGTLFEALRTTGETEAVVVEPEEPLSTDPFELKDQLLLPVLNGGAREAKRRVVDLQNVALDALRGKGWTPDALAVMRELRAAIEPMIHKAASAGATAAGPLAGVAGALSHPGDRAAGLVADMAASLAGELGAVLEEGGGPEMEAAAVSRVFREWRTDSVDRWSLRISSAAYHDSLLSALSDGGVESVVGVATGSACDECPGRSGESWVPGGPTPDGTSVPPVHLDCACSFIPAVK